jgi:hypothetical protein
MANSINGPFFFPRRVGRVALYTSRIITSGPVCGTARSVAAPSRRSVQPNAGRHEEAAT